MRLSSLLTELELCVDDEALVEIDGVCHAIHEVLHTSQGPVIVVDTREEDREMR